VEKELLAPDGHLVIVITSTYNGQPPDNAKNFKTWLAEQKEGSLAGLRFAVFGVGNSQWSATYQQFPREVDAGLQRCGAQRVQTLGACDVDSPSWDADFDGWLAALMTAVGGTTAGGDAGLVIHSQEAGPYEFTLEEGKGDAGPVLGDIATTMAALKKAKEAAVKAGGSSLTGRDVHFHDLEVVEDSRELCQQPKGRSVRHVTLRLPAAAPAYRAGDHLEVLPPNDPTLVAATLDALGMAPTAPVTWEPRLGRPRIRSVDAGAAEIRSRLPKFRVEAHVVLEWVPDLAAPPGRKVLASLAAAVAATDAEIAAELRALSEDTALHAEKVVKPQLSLAELLQRYKGRLTISFGAFCAIVKPLGPRYYSVSSSPAGAKDPKLVTVSVGQVEFTTGSGRVHRGLASTNLGLLTTGGVVPGSVRTLQGGFHLPADAMAPILMVGPGTGVAPMMGFLQEREHILKKLGPERLGPAVLFFGCRNRNEDYLYRDELAGHLASGALSKLHVAFSREGPQKVYVQDVIWEQRETVWKLLQHPKSAVYVCGDARSMAPDVKRAFQRVVEECGGRSVSGATNMIGAMVEGGRYLEDVWAS